MILEKCIIQVKRFRICSLVFVVAVVYSWDREVSMFNMTSYWKHRESVNYVPWNALVSLPAFTSAGFVSFLLSLFSYSSVWLCDPLPCILLAFFLTWLFLRCVCVWRFSEPMWRSTCWRNPVWCTRSTMRGEWGQKGGFPGQSDIRLTAAFVVHVNYGFFYRGR